MNNSPARALPRTSRWPTVVGAVVVFLCTFLLAVIVYRSLTTNVTTNDIREHIRLVIVWVTGGPAPGYTIFYPVLALLSGGDYSYERLRSVTVWLLAFFMALKALSTYWFLLPKARGRFVLVVAATAFVMLAVPLNFSRGYLYYGKFSPAVWHNSTTVMLAGASMVLFVATVRYFGAIQPSRWAWLAIGALSALNAAIKPSFVLVLLPALVLLRLVSRRDSALSHASFIKRFLVLAVPAGVVVVIEYVLAYTLGGTTLSNRIEPMRTWLAIDSTVVISLAESFLVPVVGTWALWRVARHDRFVQLAWLAAGVGLLQFALFSEYVNGVFATPTNWAWGLRIALFLLQAALVRAWLTLERGQRRTIPLVITYALAVAQTLWGLRYLQMMITTTNYF